MKKLQEYGIKNLEDGLTLKELEKDFSWILAADIRNAIIGKDKFGLIWKNGTWEYGWILQESKVATKS